jgi:hypothetical protein
MAIEAPLCNYKNNNFKLGIIILIVAAAWFAFDGYYSDTFQKKHTLPDGKPDSTLVFHRKWGPTSFVIGAVLLAGYFWMVRGKKIIADEQGLIFSEDEKINYDAVQSINKSNFDSKGYFVVVYKDEAGNDKKRKISDKTYDNLAAILDQLVSKIT